MPTYQLCSDVDKSVDKMIKTLMLFTADHTALEQSKVTINALFAYARCDKRGKALEPAITVNRYPAIACIKVTSYKDRIKGLADAEMLIDHEWWTNHNEEQCKAVLDHELMHLMVVVDAYDRPQNDAAGRPKLKTRLHDLQIGYFHGIARRHGANSQEYAQARDFMQVEMTQLYFPDFFIEPHSNLLEKVNKALEEGKPKPATAV